MRTKIHFPLIGIIFWKTKYKTMPFWVIFVYRMDNRSIHSAVSHAESFCPVCNFKIHHDETFYDAKGTFVNANVLC